MIRSPFFWTAVGFGVGLFWLGMAFLFFSGGPSFFVSLLFNGVAVATCPPLIFGHDYFLAPFANAALYGAAAFLLLRAGKRRVNNETN